MKEPEVADGAGSLLRVMGQIQAAASRTHPFRGLSWFPSALLMPLWAGTTWSREVAPTPRQPASSFLLLFSGSFFASSHQILTGL